MRRAVATFIFILLLTSLLPADEGMWLFNAPPRQKIKTRYGFDLSKQWLDHLRESSVRFNNGGSGSFVSADGLAFTNHHVGADCLQKLSTPEKDYLKLGYYARTQSDEGKCPDLELNVLLAIDDVTVRVNAGVQPGMSTAAAGQAQRAAMSAIEAECAKDPKTRCDVVTLYSGGMYHLYRYRKYTDVRIVFAPEVSVASFGGDPDNFEFPRYDLDICFFRVYEDDKPVKLAHFLKWTRSGVRDGDLVFMSGHPGSTSRLNTMAEMDFLRDVQYPFALSNQQRRIKLLIDFSSRTSVSPSESCTAYRTGSRR